MPSRQGEGDGGGSGGFAGKRGSGLARQSKGRGGIGGQVASQISDAGLTSAGEAAGLHYAARAPTGNGDDVSPYGSRYPASKASERGRLHPASPESEDRAWPVRARGVGASEDLSYVLPHGPPQVIAAT